MEDLKALFIGMLGSILIIALSRVWRSFRVYSLKLDVKNLDAEISNIELISKSNPAFLIFSFQGIFIVLALLGFSYCFSVSMDFIKSDRALLDWLELIFSTIPASIAVYFLGIYKHLNNVELAVTKMKLKKFDIEQKISKR